MPCTEARVEAGRMPRRLQAPLHRRDLRGRDGNGPTLIGDLEAPEPRSTTIVERAATAMRRASDGLVPWSERPAAVRKGVVAPRAAFQTNRATTKPRNAHS